MGLPNLASISPGNIARVAAANKLFVLSAEICTYLCHRRIPWTLENPRRSIFWWVPEVDALLGITDIELGPRACSVGDVMFQHCMHGGARDKWTRLRCYPASVFASLALSCNKDHVHKQWGAAGPGRFYTADEAEFPPLLCSRIASLVKCHTQQSVQQSSAKPIISHPVQAHNPQPAASTSTTVHTAGDITPAPISVQPARTVLPATTPSSSVTAYRIAAGVQPRGNAGPNLIPEFKSTTLVRVNAADVDTARNLVGSKLSGWADTVFPKDTRALSLKYAVGVSGREEQHFLEIGIPWSPEEFLQQSLLLEHPYAQIAVDDDVLRSAFCTLTSSLACTRRLRDQALEQWTTRSAELEAKEETLRNSAHPDVRPSIESKRILLFGEMLSSVGFPSAERLMHRMAVGFPLAGKLEETGMFPALHRPASSSLPELWSSARDAQRTALLTLGPSDDPELDDAVTESTAEEVSRGWLRGPVSAAGLTNRHGLWVPARRFGIRQGSGTRVIDDYSELGQNACVESTEKVDVGGVDVIAGMIKGVLSAVDPETRQVSFKLSDGSVLDGQLHPDWSLEEASSLLGKVWDLSKAYRQLARSPAHASISIVATFNSKSRCTELYEQVVLPFGSTASVYDFNWVARALQMILLKGFGIICTHYFDDYPTIEFKALAPHTQVTVDAIFKLLGWDTKVQKPFAVSFEALGVECDLTETKRGLFRFKNKRGRVEEISNTVGSICERGLIKRGEARPIRGRIIFARSQTFGRCGAVALKALGEIADGTKGTPVLDQSTQSALRWLVQMLFTARPREIKVRVEEPILLFVDGACEGETEVVASVGAVLFDTARPDLGPLYFGTRVGEPVVKLWSRFGKQQLIGQAELLPVLLAKTTWPERFVDRMNITFIDNNSAMFGLIRGYSPVLDSASLINESWLMDAQLGTASWYARVPTASNIADAPSRLDFSEISKYRGSKFYNVALPNWSSGELWQVLANRLSRDL